MIFCKLHKIRKKREPKGKLRCSLCNIQKSKQFRKENPNYAHEAYGRRIVVEMFRKAKNRAKEKKIPFSIIIEDIQIPRKCPILGIELKVAKGGPRDYSPTLDRVVPSLGYTPGNILVISHKANRIKNNATAEEILAVAEFMRKYASIRVRK